MNTSSAPPCSDRAARGAAADAGPARSRLTRAVARQERALLLSLGLWAVASTAVGVQLVRIGRARQQPALAAVGRQALAWGLVDGVIALLGARRGGRSAADEDAARRSATRWFVLTGANALLDVGYLVGAVTVARNPRWRWDGLGMLPQAGFLLALDSRHAVHFLGHVWPRAQRGRLRGL